MVMDKWIIKFYDDDIKKYTFHQNKSPIPINNIDISKLALSNKLPFNKKDFIYFTGYKDDKKNYTFIHILSKNKCI